MNNEHTHQADIQSYNSPQCTYPIAPSIPKLENAFKPDTTDFVFALITFLLGYLCTRWVFFAWTGLGVSVFTTLYLLCTSLYFLKKGVFTKTPATWFWLTVTFAVGVSYGIWNNIGLQPIRALLLFGSAALYVISASGRSAVGKTDSSSLIDALNVLIIVPFRNLINQYVSFKVLGNMGNVLGKQSKSLHILLGVAISLILVTILIPLLERADSGGFGVILDFFRNLFDIGNHVQFNLGLFIFHMFFAIPVAAFMYGLTSGVAHKKGTDIIKQESVDNAAASVRILQPVTVFVLLSVTCALYLIFILSQLPYFFSAFTGSIPYGWLLHSEFARQGFFELCWIAAINLALLAICNSMCKKRRIESKALRAFNIALSVITLVLIATAFSKMILYVHVFGLTMLRLLPCVFMLFLAIIFIAIIVRQLASFKKEFSIVRFSLIVGAIMLSLLSLANPDSIVVRYNADRYLSGTLREFDLEIVRRADLAGIIPAIEVYENTQDTELKTQIRESLYRVWDSSAGAERPFYSLSVESHLALQSLELMFGDVLR
ncbi:MAG: DUF4173 domain-containing protein [Oscillospiraceae bacterium]|nr:DUF4173 domain-containing protein [Oscillospiraceae bacterium]